MNEKGQMKLYTSTGTRKFIEDCNKYDVGLMMVAPTWRNPSNWPYFAVDNGCYSAHVRNVDWPESDFIRMLNRIKESGLRPDFIVIPDKVADAEKTLELADRWVSDLRDRYPDFPKYMTVQDGMEPSDVEPYLSSIDGIFVGGTLDWKLDTMRTWCQLAHDRGIGCHVGRIGPIKRMFLAELSGADSIDSTTWVQVRGGIERYVGSYKKQTKLEVSE